MKNIDGKCYKSFFPSKNEYGTISPLLHPQNFFRKSLLQLRSFLMVAMFQSLTQKLLDL